MNQAAQLLYTLKEKGIDLWVEEEGEDLSFAYDPGKGFSDAVKDKVRMHKKSLLELLHFNGVRSEAQSKACLFYKLPSNNKVPLSPIQRGMWSQSLQEPLKYTYTVPFFFPISKPCSEKLKKDIARFLDQTPLFRMAVDEKGEWVLLDVTEIPLHEVNISEQEIETVKHKFAKTCFEPCQALCHVVVIWVQESQDVIVGFMHHHMLSDAFSLSLIETQLRKLLEDRQQGPKTELTYSDHHPYQQALFETKNYQDASCSLKQGLLETTGLVLPKVIPPKESAPIHHDQMVFESDLYQALKQRCVKEKISPYAALLTSIYSTLQTYSGLSDPFPIGVTLSHRHDAFREVIGPFISLLPFIPTFQGDDPIDCALKNAHQLLLHLQRVQHLSLAQLIEGGSFKIREKMPVLFTFHNFITDDTSQNERILETVEKFGISFTAQETPQGGLLIHITYAPCYGVDLVQGMVQTWKQAARFLATGDLTKPLYTLSQQSWSEVKGMGEGDKVSLPPIPILHRLIEAQAQKTPLREAVRFAGQSLTYQALDQKASQIAAILHHRFKVRNNTPICVCFDRGFQMIKGLLGVLKAGGAYVPMDPTYPPTRITFMLKDTQTPLILTQRKHQAFLKSLTDLPLLVVEDCEDDQPQPFSSETQPRDLAYLIYTSGTTGQPKGVMCTHQGIVNRLMWMSHACPLHRHSRILQKTPYVFDVSLWELFWPLLNGSCLVFAEQEAHKDPDQLVQVMDGENITIVHFVPSLLPPFLKALDQKGSCLKTLEHVACSGEALNPSQAQAFKKKLPHVALHNLYGPTETSVDVTHYVCAGNESVIPIGQPIFNTQLYILGKYQQPIPQGAVGELYLGGIGVARGYWERDDLTQERFLKNPLKKRLYRTGDLVRMDKDHQLLFLGRCDFQVKMRGHRIELQEIEHALSEHDLIENVVVVVGKKPSREDGLFAYYVAKKTLSEESLRAFLKATLPSYMLPDHFTALDAMPLTISGKVDRKRLPKPKWEASPPHEKSTLNAQEQNLANAWSRLLNLPNHVFKPEDDFFHLGGDSILAIQLASLLKQEGPFQVKDIFHHRTLCKMAKILPLESKNLPQSFQGVQHAGHLINLSMEEDRDPHGWFEMTDIQKAYLLGRSSHYEMGNIANHVYSEFYYDHLDPKRLEHALNYLIQHRPSLRVVFSPETLKQRFLKATDVPPYRIHIHQEDLAKRRRELSHKVYNVTQWPLFTFEVTKFQDQWVLHVSIDLILLDVQSRLMFFKDLSTLYQNPQSELSHERITFKQYQAHIESLKQSPWYEKDKAYWQEKLPNMPSRPTFAFKTQPHLIKHPFFNHHTLFVDPNTWKRFKQRVDELGLSASSALLACYGRVLAIFSGMERFLITLTLFNRYAVHGDVPKIWGDFTSTLLFAFEDQALDLDNLAKKTHGQLWEDIQHGFYSGVQVQRDLGHLMAWDPHQALSPLIFTSVLGGAQGNFEKTPFLDATESITKRYWCAQTSQAWIDLQAVEMDGRLMSKWLYVENVFTPDQITRMNKLFCRLISLLSQGKQMAFSSYSNSHLICAQKQGTIRTYSKMSDEVMHAQFIMGLSHLTPREKKAILPTQLVAQKHPQKTLIDLLKPHRDKHTPALWDEQLQQTFSHHELWRDSDRTAAFLLKKMKQGEPLVALCSEKGYLQVVGVLGILKTKRAYLPLSCEWPVERIAQILKQAGVKTLVITKAYGERFQGVCQNTWVMEDVLEPKNPRPADTLPKLSGKDAAYVIFTSGSTGVPKGVTITHESAVNTIEAVNKRFQVGDQDAVLALSDLSFDLSVYDLFGLLGVGGRIILPDQKDVKNPLAWSKMIQDHKVTIWNTVPQLADLLNTENPGTVFAFLRLFLLSGDWIPLSLPPQLQKQCPSATVMGLGGATEASIWSIWYEIQGIDPDWTSVPYGYAMPGQQLYVFNHYLQPCPFGVPGDLYIGGLGLAKNYWAAPDLAQNAFIHHPALGRLYRTGDQGVYGNDGIIFFLGRKDSQVKRHGYRVELKEIEKTILGYPAVEQAVITLKGGQLIAYYKASYTVEGEKLIAYLQEKLPSYMVPDHLVSLKEIPLNANGKVDLAGLSSPLSGDHVFQQPRTKTEADLKNLWADVLDIRPDCISCDQSFFHLGGDSLTGIRLIARVKQAWDVALLPQDIFEKRTVVSLAQLIETRKPEKKTLSEQGKLTGKVPLLPIQKWFFSQHFEQAHHWNQAFLIKTPRLDVSRLESCLQELIAYHDVLRLRFLKDPETVTYRASYTDEKPTVLLYTGSKDDAHLNQWQSSFSLEKGPLCAFGYLTGYEDQSSRVFCAFHHLIIDTVSWRIFFEDLQTLYAGKSLPPKGTSFRQWSQLITQDVPATPSEISHWETVSTQKGPSLKPLCDGISKTFEGSLDAATTEKFLRSAHVAYGTQVNDLLLAALVGALYDLTGKTKHLIALEGHGRESMSQHEDITRTLGWFTTLYPVVLDHHENLKYLIITTKEALRSIPRKGLGYGALMGYEKQVAEISFNYLGQMRSSNQDGWGLVFETSGLWVHPENHLPFNLTVNCLIQQDCFQLHLNSLLREDRLKDFGNFFLEHLRAIVGHTTQQNKREMTPSDVGWAIDPAVLEELQQDRCLEAIYPATSLQQGFFSQGLQFAHHDDAYRVQSLWLYEKPIDLKRLEKAWELTQQAFPALRLGLVWAGDLLQVIEQDGNLKWIEEDISTLTPSDQQTKIESILQHDRRTLYDFAKAPLFRLYMIKQSPEKTLCLLNIHHAITDGWSASLLMHAVHETYLRLQQGQPVNLRHDEAYDASQNYLIKRKGQDLTYWKEHLKNLKERIKLDTLVSPFSNVHHIKNHRCLADQASESLVINQPVFEKIQDLARRENVTLSTCFQYVWHKVLTLYGSANQTVVGTVFSGRHLPVEGIESSVGLHATTLPLMLDHGDYQESSVLEALHLVQQTIQEAAAHTAVPLSELQHGTRLFDTLFMYEKAGDLFCTQHQEALGIVSLSNREKRDYPLACVILEANQQITIQLDYATDLFSQRTIQGVLKTFHHLIQQIAISPHQKVAALSFVEKKLNVSQEAPVSGQIIHEAFEAQVRKTPFAVAVKDDKNVLTYQDLNAKANQLASWILMHHPCALETPIALLLDRDVSMIVALLAILKVGGAYVPLNPKDPDARLQFFLEDTKTPLVITQDAFVSKLPQTVPRINLDEEVTKNCDARNHNRKIFPQNLAYVLYTSGTTGKPKGVMVEHQAYMTTVLGFRAQFFPTKGPLSTHSLTQLTFDIFGMEYGLTLLSGGTLTLGKMDGKPFDCGDFFQTTPSVLEVVEPLVLNTSQTTLLIGGESPSQGLMERSFARFGRVITVYGPTETTIWSCAHLHTNTPNRHVVLGKALPYESIDVLDVHKRPLPPHAPGTIHIGGRGLARGYWRQPNLTKQRFMFAEEEKFEKTYDTGDQGYWDEFGNLVFQGRKDTQIKVRGVRIECLEVEVALTKHNAVKQAVVVPKKEGNETWLTAYVMATPETSIQAEKLKAFLNAFLPDVMIPQSFILVRSFPLNASGKIDTKALSATKPNLAPVTPSIKDSGETEDILIQLFQEALHAKKIDPQANFFDQGAHSLILLKVYNQLPQMIKECLEMVDFFTYPTIQRLTQHIDQHPMRTLKKTSFQNSDKKMDDIAIIGMAGRFPGADTLDVFWEVVQSGRPMTSLYTQEELEAEGIDSKILNHPHYVRAQNRLNHLTCFDANFFGYSKREAEMMDPQHRFLMECAWEALQDADLDPKASEDRIGIYAGCGHNLYGQSHVLPHLDPGDEAAQYQAMIHTQDHFLCTKIAYKLGLTGPAMTIQTACSTSLVAVHQAVQSLLLGECEVALAGGVAIRQFDKQGYFYQEGLVFSPDVFCYPFEQRAQGTVEGQGVGLVVLKPLQKALENGDPIHAIIKATGVNNDGNLKAGYTAPSPRGQATLIRGVYRKAGVTADQVSFIETHGTGTPLGDPIEIKGLLDAFQGISKKRFCALGTLKHQIGHLDVAAGIAGLIKTVLCLKHRMLPPSSYYQRPHPHIRFEDTPFFINTQLTPWESDQGQRLAGVSSFGIGGTNAHVLLQEYPDQSHERQRYPKRRYQLQKTQYWLEKTQKTCLQKPKRSLPLPSLDALSSTLQTLWDQALGDRQTDQDKDFFQMGGDSLAAIQLQGHLKKMWNVNLDVMSLKPATLRSLIDAMRTLLSDNLQTMPSKLLSLMQRGDPTLPCLVLIHPIGGDLHFYRNLVDRLPPEINVYGIRSPLLESDAMAFQSLEALAQYYVTHLSQEVESPYFLGGHSFGGIVAYAMAQLLKAQPPLILVDPPAHGNLPKPMGDCDIFCYLLTYGTPDLGVTKQELLAHASIESQLNLLQERSKNTPYAPLFEAPFLKRFLKTWQHHTILMQSYVPPPYQGPVYFFTHTEPIPDFPTSQETHWKKWAKGFFKTLPCPGHHLNMISPPHVDILAQKISTILNETSFFHKLTAL